MKEMKPLNQIEKVLYLVFGSGIASTAPNQQSKMDRITTKPYKVQFFKEWVLEDGTVEANEHGYTVRVENLPGCVSEGDTLEQAEENIIEAISLMEIEGLSERRKYEMRCMDCGKILALLDRADRQNENFIGRKVRCSECYDRRPYRRS